MKLLELLIIAFILTHVFRGFYQDHLEAPSLKHSSYERTRLRQP